MDQLFTIGAYGFDTESFFATLQEARVDVFVDLRRRRGMRGGLYAFANAVRLQETLATLDIAYLHLLDLAPMPQTRELQEREDHAARVAKRQRTWLGDAFVGDYTQRTLESFDWPVLLAQLEPCQRPVLFCVEREAVACHRRLVAARLHQLTGVPVTDLPQ